MPRTKTNPKPKTPIPPASASASPAPRLVMTVFGFDGCGYLSAAVAHLQAYSKLPKVAMIIKITSVSRSEWPKVIQQHATQKGISHTTSPLIFCNNVYVGGHDAVVKRYCFQRK